MAEDQYPVPGEEPVTEDDRPPSRQEAEETDDRDGSFGDLDRHPAREPEGFLEASLRRWEVQPTLSDWREEEQYWDRQRLAEALKCVEERWRGPHTTVIEHGAQGLERAATRQLSSRELPNSVGTRDPSVRRKLRHGGEEDGRPRVTWSRPSSAEAELWRDYEQPEAARHRGDEWLLAPTRSVKMTQPGVQREQRSQHASPQLDYRTPVARDDQRFQGTPSASSAYRSSLGQGRPPPNVNPFVPRGGAPSSFGLTTGAASGGPRPSHGTTGQRGGGQPGPVHIPANPTANDFLNFALEQNRLLAQQLSKKNEGGQENQRKWDRQNFPVCDAKTDVLAFLHNFETACFVEQVPEDQMCRILRTQVRDSSLQKILAEMPWDELHNYRLFRHLVQVRLALTPESLQQKFKSLQKQSKMTWSETAAQIHQVGMAWLDSAQVTTFADLVDLIFLERFYDLVPSDLIFYVTEKRPVNVLQAGQFLDEILARGVRNSSAGEPAKAFKQGGSSSGGGSKDQEKDHRRPWQQQQQRSQSFGNRNQQTQQRTSPFASTQRSQPSAPNKSTQQPSNKSFGSGVRCHDCGEIGHIRKECTKGKKDTRPLSKYKEGQLKSVRASCQYAEESDHVPENWESEEEEEEDYVVMEQLREQPPDVLPARPSSAPPRPTVQEDAAERVPLHLAVVPGTSQGAGGRISQVSAGAGVERPGPVKLLTAPPCLRVPKWSDEPLPGARIVSMKEIIPPHHRGRPGARPIAIPPRGIKGNMAAVIDREIDLMLDLGVIQPSVSPWASPIVVVEKKRLSADAPREYRFCVDYRKLNAVSLPDRYPLTNLDELLETVAGAKFLTTLDMCKGYWQMEMHPDSAPLTAFATPRGLFEFRRLAFGLAGAPANFQRLVNALLKKHCGYAVGYLDDICIYSNTWEDHVEHVKSVFQTLLDAGLTLRADKCQFAKASVQYLGHVVGGGTIEPMQAKVEAILNWPVPKTKKQVLAFLGLSGFYRKFGAHFSTLATPLTNLCRKHLPLQVKWTPECQQAFDALKRSLSIAPVLVAPDYSKPFIVQTDASQTGLGAVLLQEHDLVLHPVVYLSRKLLPREQNYSISELECLAIVWALGKLRPYLWGTKFEVQTDHSPLTFLARAKGNQRLLRWQLALQDFSFEIRYLRGKKNILADSLSRAWGPAEVDAPVP